MSAEAQTETNGEHPQGVGRFVRTRDGRNLYVMERGRSESGAPTVVFEAGMASPRSSWALVQPAVSQWARAVVYDRAGLGRSEPDTQPRTLTRMADDLDDLLDALGDGPFVLVAHSGGALIVRAVAERRPERIAGVVLVDPTDEGCEIIFARSFRRLEWFAHYVSCFLARVGLLERLYRPYLAVLPAAAFSEFREEGFTRSAMRTRGAELTGMVAATNAWRADVRALQVPVTVISGKLADMGMSEPVRAAANAAHVRRAQLSTAGRHVVAERSGHMIPFTEPTVIVAEIIRLTALPR